MGKVVSSQPCTAFEPIAMKMADEMLSRRMPAMRIAFELLKKDERELDQMFRQLNRAAAKPELSDLFAQPEYTSDDRQAGAGLVRSAKKHLTYLARKCV
jgi:uncharacterized protein YehS (DUF1456 family)